jgi:hypothetical protein
VPKQTSSNSSGRTLCRPMCAMRSSFQTKSEISTRALYWGLAGVRPTNLEPGGGDEAVRRQGGFGYAEQEWRSIGGLAAAVHHLLVLFHEAEAVDLLPI